MSFLIAWDKRSKLISYISTADPHFITDSELGVGGLCRLSEESKPVHYMDWIISSEWADTARDISGDASWYAALEFDKKYRHQNAVEYGVIKAFVQSRYLKATSPKTNAGAPRRLYERLGFRVTHEDDRELYMKRDPDVSGLFSK